MHVGSCFSNGQTVIISNNGVVTVIWLTSEDRNRPTVNNKYRGNILSTVQLKQVCEGDIQQHSTPSGKRVNFAAWVWWRHLVSCAWTGTRTKLSLRKGIRSPDICPGLRIGPDSDHADLDSTQKPAPIITRNKTPDLGNLYRNSCVVRESILVICQTL